MNDPQALMIQIITDDPGIPMSLAVYRFLRTAEGPDRIFPYSMIFDAIMSGRIRRVKEGPSVRLYPGQLPETGS